MKLTTLALALTVTLAAAAAPAHAITIASFTTTATSGVAGAHPDVSTSFSFANKPGVNPPSVDGTLRSVRLDLPPGLIGDPHGADHCSADLFAAGNCPASSQVGAATFILQFGFGQLPLDAKVFNLVPGSDEPALLGIPLGVTNVYVRFSARTDGDYGLVTTIDNVAKNFPVVGSTLTLWGVPADHNNSGAPRKPFMTNATSCSPDAPVTTLGVTSLEDPDTVKTATSQAVVPPSTAPAPVTGCDSLAFAPTIDVTPETTQADTPSGYTVVLQVPQNGDPDGRATSELRGAKVTLPPGAGIAPGAADGLQACTDDQLAFGSNASPTCPEASKVGTVSIDVPLLDAPVAGDIFLGSPTAANPFRVFLVARGSGLLVKLRGNVSPDPATGQLTTTFADNPQVPFSRFTLSFKGGPRAILANPRTCGTATTTSALSPWSGGPDVTPTSSFDVVGCTSEFSPSFVAGTTSSQAGGDTSFSLTLRRADGQPELGAIRLSMPPGLLGRLAAVPLCPADRAAAGTCDDASLVGSSSVAAGPGPQPFTLPGKVYLAAPAHPGDVAALAIVVRAIAGPFDLGTVVVQTGIRLRPEDSGLDIVSDPLPSVLAGIPLRLRTIGVDIDRPGFMINPTSCNPLTVTGTISALTGETAAVSAPFQARNCSALPLRPTFSASLSGGTQRASHPAFKAVITQPPGDANLRSTAVTLPSQLGIDLNTVSKSTCPPAQLASDTCPPASNIGTGTAVTPVLAAPLTGPAYLVQAAGFPHLVVRLRGQVSLDLEGAIAPDSNGRLVTTFGQIPDVPISRFELAIKGGKQSSLIANQKLCGTSPASRVTFVGQNGKRVDNRVAATVAGCSTKAKKKVKRRAHQRRARHR